MTDDFLYVAEWGLTRDTLTELIGEGEIGLSDWAEESLARSWAVERRIAEHDAR